MRWLRKWRDRDRARRQYQLHHRSRRFRSDPRDRPEIREPGQSESRLGNTSGEMMFRYMGWTEAADLILKGLNGAIASKRVTYDFARLMDGATEIKCSEFGDNVIEHM